MTLYDEIVKISMLKKHNSHVNNHIPSKINFMYNIYLRKKYLIIKFSWICLKSTKEK